MKKLASLLVAASAALACAQSFALAPTVTPEFTVTLSGASAQDAGILRIFQSLCAPGTIDYFTNVSAAKPKDYNGYSCSIPVSAFDAANLPAGVTPIGNLAARDTDNNGFVDVMLLKRSAGGSGKAFSGVCGDVSGTLALVVDNTCTDSGLNGFNGVAGKWWNCNNHTAPRQSDGGLADLEQNKFPAADTAACAGVALKTQAIWGTIFNTPVSLNLRNALQCVQGLTVNAEDEANMPNLPKEVIASAFNGGFKSWDSLQALKADGVTYAPLSVALADRVGAGMCPGYDASVFPIPTTTVQKRVVVCRRPDSSGTNNQFRVKFLNAGCSAEAQDELADNTGANTNVETTVTGWQNIGASTLSAAFVEASAGGDMASCLGAFASPNEAASLAGQRWAIGHQSLENNVGRADKYRFIKVDGNAPTVANVLTHKYSDWVESNWVWLTSASTQDQKDAVDFQEIMLKKTGAAAAVGGLVTSTFIHSFGASGLVALNTIPGNVPSLPISAANPVATASHSNGGASSCRTPQIKVNTAF